MPYHKMKDIYLQIQEASQAQKKLLAVLIDPEKTELAQLPEFLALVDRSVATHIFVGGSTDKNKQTQVVVAQIKQHSKLPVILFPGDVSHLSPEADALLFLSLISGRNPEYLIEQQLKAVPYLKKTTIEVIPTGYILIDGGHETAVQRISNTSPMAQNKAEMVVNTALAGAYLGYKLIYLEAGSGASIPVNPALISAVKKELSLPLIVGGGIRNAQQLDQAYHAGADMVVIGTAFENDTALFKQIVK